MTTLAEITYQVAREITEVLNGAATAGTTTTLTDATNLTQQNQYWDRGPLWIRSGTNAGRVLHVTGYSANRLTFAALAQAIAAGDRFAVARAIFPWRILVQNINAALDEIRVTQVNSTLTGDGETLEFTLPAGVSDVHAIEIQKYDSSPARHYPSHHWKPRPGGKIKFDYGYAPGDGDPIHLFYKDYHDELVDYDDTVHQDVNTEWLKWKAAEHCLYWGIKTYQDAKEYRLEELMNKAMSKQKGLIATPITFMVRTAGG